MAVGTFNYQNASGYSERIENPAEYQNYNLIVGNGLVDNQTSATVTLYSDLDGRGDSDYLYPNSSRYLSRGYRSFKFTS
ncbi:hypothetical protein ACLMAJ_13645 [Nocardia sp. KC 131]|uniref:hypothetical protein n=1 Tax=Nocardia arseniciresistens TaxID=3392119 RepID=UPI00398E6EFE